MATLEQLREMTEKMKVIKAQERTERKEEAARKAVVVVEQKESKPKKERKAPDLVLQEKTDCIIETLRIGGRDLPDEIRETIEKEYVETPGLKDMVMRRQIADTLLNSSGRYLPWTAVQSAVEMKAFVAISNEDSEEIANKNQAVREHRRSVKNDTEHPRGCSDCRFTFVYQARNAEGTVDNYVVDDNARWLKNVLKERHDFLKGMQESWDQRLKDLGINPRAKHDVYRVDLLKIAQGEKLATVAYVPKHNPFMKRNFRDGVMVGQRAYFGSFIVRGFGQNEEGILELEIVQFEEDESRMFRLAKRFFPPAVFRYRTLRRDDDVKYAFSGIQEKSGNRVEGALRALLLKALGVKDERENQPAPGINRNADPTKTQTGLQLQEFKEEINPAAADSSEEIPKTTSNKKDKKSLTKGKSGEKARRREEKVKGGSKNLKKDALSELEADAGDDLPLPADQVPEFSDAT